HRLRNTGPRWRRAPCPGGDAMATGHARVSAPPVPRIRVGQCAAIPRGFDDDFWSHPLRRRGGNAMNQLPLYQRFYAEELRAVAELRSEVLVQAFATVPREAFLGPGPWQIFSLKHGMGAPEYRPTPDANPEHVHHNVVVAIDTARKLNNGQPSALAPAMEAL